MDGIIGYASGPTFGGSSKVDSAKQPEAVSADSPFTVGKVLGRSIPIVIGTYEVDGIPVIGGSVVTQAITGYTTEQAPITGVGYIIGFSGGGGIIGGGGGGGGGGTTVQVPVYGTQQTAQLGYLLAFDPFGDGYELIRLMIDINSVYDAEHGIGASETFRFYGGTQTAVDPITQKIIGTNAGAWKRFAMVFLAGYATGSEPRVKAVLSNSATATPGDGDIAWTGTAPSGIIDSFPHGSAYDPAESVIYQLFEPPDIPGLSQVWLAVLEADTRVERYRIPLEGSDPYTSGAVDFQLSVPIVMRGSGLLFVHFATLGVPNRMTAVYDTATGKLVASYVDTVNMTWLTAQPMGQKWVFLGESFDDSPNIMAAVFDPATATIDVANILGSGPNTYVAVKGRVTSSFTSFFSATAAVAGAVSVYELRYDGDNWSAVLLASLTGVTSLSVDVLWFDPLTGYLVINYHTSGPTNRFTYIDPEDGSVVDTFTTTASKSYSNVAALIPTFHDRLISKPGFVAMFETSSGNDVVILNIQAKTFSTFASGISAVDGTRLSYVIVDQAKALWINALGAYKWTVHKLPGTIPGAVSVSDFIITKAASLGHYTPDQLTFEGFEGLTGYGVGILTNSNIKTVFQSLADIYGFKFADTGAGMYFKKPGRDDAFALDAVLTTADLVFGDTSAVEGQDEAEIRQVSRVELQYVSKTDYTTRPASFSMPTIGNSIRVEQYSSPIVLTDEDAQTFVTEKYFELQASQRNFSFSVTGEDRFLPGDVISLPVGTITYSAQIDSVDLNRNMVCDIQAYEFQTSVSTTITPVSNVGLSPVAVTLQTQYIHLDVPLFRYSDDLGGLGLRQYGVVASRGQAGWGGGVLYRGDTSANLTALLSQAPPGGVIGVCVDQFNGPVDPFATTDVSTVTFRKTAGSAALLVDKTEDQVLAGENFAYIGNQGRWEGVGYKTVVDNGDGTFTLSGFTIRGYRGTEVFAYGHQVGDLFVMIDPAWLKGVVHPLTDLDTTKYYKAIGISQNPATGTVVPHTIIGAAETPYACVNLAAVAAVPNGIDISWDYRSRLATGTNPADFGEAALAFEIDIYAADGVTYKRTLTSSTGSVHYATADVVTDLGSDPPSELFYRVYMMSALDILVPGQDRPVAGRGYEARGHKYFSGIGSPIGLLLTLTKA